MKKNIKNLFFFNSRVVLLEFVLIVIAFMFSILIFSKKLGAEHLEQIIFHANMSWKGMTSTDPELIKYAVYVVVKGLLIMFFLLSLIRILTLLNFKRVKNISNKNLELFKDLKCANLVYAKSLFIFLALWFFIMVGYFILKLEGIEYMKRVLQKPSVFYEKEYVAPDTVNIKFGKDKKNLIVIYLESVEKTFFRKDLFGDNLLPNMYNLSKKNISFAGGFKPVIGTTWSIAGVFAGWCGIPFKPVVNSNSYNYKSFFSNVVCLPDILKKHGYDLYFVQGSSLEFSGMNNFFKSHGIDNTYDYNNMEMWIDGKYQKVWGSEKHTGNWGVSDNGLYKFVREKLIEVSKQKKPFMFNLMTIDTHGPQGDLNSECNRIRAENKQEYRKNVYRCADDMLFDFINWLEKQDFYKDTVVVILGDHLTMYNDDLRDLFIKDKNRQLMNIWINPVEKVNVDSHKIFSTLDFFPTILETIGVKIEGRRLGLGVSLLSDEKTLLEKYGLEIFDKYIYQKNRLYETFR